MTPSNHQPASRRARHVKATHAPRLPLYHEAPLTPRFFISRTGPEMERSTTFLPFNLRLLHPLQDPTPDIPALSTALSHLYLLLCHHNPLHSPI